MGTPPDPSWLSVLGSQLPDYGYRAMYRKADHPPPGVHVMEYHEGVRGVPVLDDSPNLNRHVFKGNVGRSASTLALQGVQGVILENLGFSMLGGRNGWLGSISMTAGQGAGGLASTWTRQDPMASLRLDLMGGTRGSTSGFSVFEEKLLEHPIREAILELLWRGPGSNRNQIKEQLGRTRSVVEFHLSRLEEVGLVTVLPGDDGREQLCFRSQDADLWDDPDARVLFGRSPIREVALSIVSHPGTSSQRIATATGRSIGAVQYHLRTLLERSLVERLRVGRTTIYRPTGALIDWVWKCGYRFALAGGGGSAVDPGELPQTRGMRT